MHLKISSAKWWPFCPGGDELINLSALCVCCRRFVFLSIVVFDNFANTPTDICGPFY